jgi:hypothetical protein
VQVKDSDDAASNTATQTVTVANVSPTVTLAATNDVSVNEGTQHSYGFSVADPGADTFSVVAVSCGANGSQVGTTSTTAAGGSFVCSFPDGPATSVVSVQVKDSDNAVSNTATQTVTVANLAPVVVLDQFTVDPTSGTVALRATFTDPGVDAFPSGGFNVTVGGVTTRVSGSISQIAGVWTMTATTRIATGCYTAPIKITADVTDSDGATGTSAARDSIGTTTDVYTATFKDPIRDNERNIAKYGNVVPVKVRLASSCSGALITSPTLYLTVSQGTGLDTYGDEIIVASVSNADTDQQMRPVDSKYMYNLSTKGNFQVNTNYEIRIRVGSTMGPIIARAHLYPKK